MTATAYFHPAFGEEVAALPRKDRIDLYLLIMAQQKLGPLTAPFPIYSFHSEFKRQVNSWFPVLGNSGVAFFDTRVYKEGFTYLHVALLQSAESEQAFFETCAARYADVQSGSVELLHLDDMMRQGDHDDMMAAIDVIVAEEKHQLYLYMINEARHEAKARLSSLFHLSPTQFDRLETRVDFYLTTLQNSLLQRGLTLTLSLNTKDDIHFTTSNFADLAKLK